MLIDTHCHLYFDAFNADREQAIARMLSAGVAGAVVVGIDAATSDQARALALSHPQLRYSAGLHPAEEFPVGFVHGGDFDAEAFLTRFWQGEPKPIAVGECGMDLHWKTNPPALQHAVFTAQLAFARERELAAIVHSREADAETLAALMAVPGTRGVLHCFAGNAGLLDFAVRHGWYVSFAGNVTYPKAEELRRAAWNVPLKFLLVETDAPFLAPQSRRGKRSEPADVVETARTLAAVRGIPEDEMHAILSANAKRLFGPRWPSPA